MILCAENPDPAIFNDRFIVRTDRLETGSFAAGEDRVNDPSSSENREALFDGPCWRIVVPGCGHLPQRESPGEIASVTHDFLARLC